MNLNYAALGGILGVICLFLATRVPDSPLSTILIVAGLILIGASAIYAAIWCVRCGWRRNK